MARGVGLSRGDLDMMVDGYYRARGWTMEGLVPQPKIEALDLADVVSESVLASNGARPEPLAAR